ncbi:MAG TPA: TIM44-like domain-containing protein [Thermoanaerobaculia bacterium]|nr:TIM44-like domain-containing protein [Thermoanaerobaculia bacterium]
MIGKIRPSCRRGSRRSSSISRGSRPCWPAAGAAALALLLLGSMLSGMAEARRPGGGQTYSGSHSSHSTHSASLSRPGGGHTFSGSSSRPGGGHTYSGGSSRGGSSRGGAPVVGLPGAGLAGCGGAGCFMLLVLLVVVILIFIYFKRGGFGGAGGASPPATPDLPPSRDLDSIRDLDPEFSVVLFEDFAYALYAKAHEARTNRGELEALAPYLSEEARAELAQRQPAGAPVSGVVIGAMRVASLLLPGGAEARPQVVTVLELESNMTLGAGTGDLTQYVRERWRLVRDAAVRSKPPEAVRSFHCPNCGAPLGPAGGERCEYCGEVVSGGRFDWSVVAIELLEVESRPPALTGTTAEQSGSAPTISHPAVAERRAELLAADPESSDEAVAKRLQLIYSELNPAWTALDLTPVRGYVSDGLFDYLQYWIAAYRSQGLRNELRNMRLTRIQLTKVIRDKHFDSLTFRIWATGRDTTVRQASGEVVGGNPNADRDYSEYWTLIRGAAVRGAPRADKSCPNCGAQLDVNMVGRCTHCDARITSGDFDWVLSKIEQDESYTG